MRVLAFAGLLVVAGCSFGDAVETRTSSDPCAQTGPWSTGPEARWVRQVVEAGGYNVFSQTGSALVASREGQEFFIWAAELARPSRGMPNWRVLARVRGVPIRGDRDLWRSWRAQGFTFWVQGPGAPAAGRLAPIVDASLRLSFPEECRA